MARPLIPLKMIKFGLIQHVSSLLPSSLALISFSICICYLWIKDKGLSCVTSVAATVMLLLIK